MDDNQIISLFFQRKEEAIQETERRYGQKLYHIAVNIVRNGEDAEESVSDTYMKTWQTIPPTRPEHFFAYLAKICRNFALSRLDWKNAAKRKGEIVSLTQELEVCIPDKRREARETGKELGQLLNAFLATLTPENRMIFLRRYWYVDTVGKIARKYGITENAVSTRLHRTREKLAKYLEKEGIAV